MGNQTQASRERWNLTQIKHCAQPTLVILMAAYPAQKHCEESTSQGTGVSTYLFPNPARIAVLPTSNHLHKNCISFLRWKQKCVDRGFVGLCTCSNTTFAASPRALDWLAAILVRPPYRTWSPSIIRSVDLNQKLLILGKLSESAKQTRTVVYTAPGKKWKIPTGNGKIWTQLWQKEKIITLYLMFF